jgi:hypothetical protein
VNSLDTSTVLHIPVDREHSALRLTIVIAFLVTWVIGFFVSGALIANTGFSLLAVLIGFALAWGVATLLERGLRGRWQSGRVVHADKDGVRITMRGQTQQEILSEDPAEIALWRFAISRRARVPKGWSVFACAVMYEDSRVSAYTFLPPAQADAFEGAERFRTLTRPSKTPDREDLRLAGEQKRLHEAEQYRWLNGAEMTIEDFKRYLNYVSTQYPEWSH